MTSYTQNANDVVSNALSKLSSRNGDIKDVDGNKVSSIKIEPGTKSSVGWNPKTGEANLTYIQSGTDKSASVPVSVDVFGDPLAMRARDAVKYFNDLSKRRSLTPEEESIYEQYSRDFDNIMNQITNTQQSVYNIQPAR